MSINTVLYDWGGVFQRTIDHAPRQELARELSTDEATLEKGVFNHPAMVEASQGKLASAEAWQKIVANLGYQGSPEEFVKRFFAGDRIDPLLISLVRWQKAHGLRVGLLSNAPPSISTAQGIAGRWGMDGLFDVQVFSHQIGVFKPHPQAFEAALCALGVAGPQVVFVDDFPENVQGAKAAGLNALLFVSVEQLLADFRRLMLPVPQLADLL